MSQHRKDAPLMCPSAPAEEGAVLLGVLGAEGSIEYLADVVPATADFLALVAVDSPAETRWRFSSPCQESRCAQWADDGCALPGRLTTLLEDRDDVPELPRCSIRPRCRWFHQSGRRACQVCPLVVTQDRSDPHEET